jgi:hypothetical protein
MTTSFLLLMGERSLKGMYIRILGDFSGKPEYHMVGGGKGHGYTIFAIIRSTE